MHEQTPEGLAAYFRDAPIDRIREDLREQRLTPAAAALAQEELHRRTGKSRIGDPSPLPPLPPRPPRAEKEAKPQVGQDPEGQEHDPSEDPADEEEPYTRLDTFYQMLKVLACIAAIGIVGYWLMIAFVFACWGSSHSICRF
jgi:hypothetical protein